MKITIYNYEKDLALFEHLLPKNVKDTGVPFLNKFIRLYGKKPEVDAAIDYILDSINDVVHKENIESNAVAEDYIIPEMEATESYAKLLLLLATKVEKHDDFKSIEDIKDAKERTKVYYLVFDTVLKEVKEEQSTLYHEVINHDTANEQIFDYQLRQYVHEYFERNGLCIRKRPTIDKSSGSGRKPSQEETKQKEKKAKKEKKTKSTPKKEATDKYEITEESVELAFIKKFVAWQGKVKTKAQVYNFIRQLQSAIVQKKVRASSPLASNIMEVQQFLIEFFDNLRGGSKTIEIPEKLYSVCKEKTNYKWADHVVVIRKYINILSETKTGLKDKAKALLKSIEKSTFEPKMKEVISDIEGSLKQYLSGKTDKPELHTYTLQGLMGLAGLSGLGNVENPMIPATVKINDTTIYPSMEIKDKTFDLLNLHGKWKDLLGHVSIPFKFMFWGGGGSGKTTLSLEFAGFLSKELNKRCLFIPNEELTNYTFIEKLNRTKASSPNLFISHVLPPTLANYDVVFIDSITTMNIGLETMIKLIEQYPGISWIWLFQTTKEGTFRGDQNWQHLVDTEIHCENGKARSLKNRFGGKAEIEIY